MVASIQAAASGVGLWVVCQGEKLSCLAVPVYFPQTEVRHSPTLSVLMLELDVAAKASVRAPDGL